MIPEISLRLALVFQSLSPMFDGFCKAVINVGIVGLFLLLIPTLYWSIDHKIALKSLLLLIFTTFICLELKLLIQQPRPFWLEGLQPLLTIPTYALPSVLAANSLALLGYLAYRFNKEWLWAASGIYIVLAAFSLLYLDLQDPTGVISGWLVGLVSLMSLLRIEQAVVSAWYRLNIGPQIGILFGLSLSIILIGTGTAYLARTVRGEASWSQFVSEVLSLEVFFSIAGVFFGAMGANLVTKKYLKYHAWCKFSVRLLRILLGFVVLTLIYFGWEWLINGLAIPGSPTRYIFHFLQFTSSALWVFYLAPWSFIKLNLIRHFPLKPRFTLPAR